MIIKNLKKYFTFEAGESKLAEIAFSDTPSILQSRFQVVQSVQVTVLDDKEVRRRFRASNYQSTTRPGFGRVFSRSARGLLDFRHPCEGEALHLHHADEVGRRLLREGLPSFR